MHIATDRLDPQLTELLVESAYDAVLSFDTRGVITAWNPSAARIFGHSRSDALGSPISILHPAGGEIGGLLFRLRQGQPVVREHVLRLRRDGGLVIVAETISPMLDETREFVAGVVIARDITAQLGAEAALKVSERLARRQSLAAELVDALETDDLEVHFQPEVALHSGELLGFEALVRWWRPSGWMAPMRFIKVAEEMGVIRAVGSHVLGRACAAIARWRDLAPESPLRVGVNVSAHQLVDPDFVHEVREALDRSAVSPECICLELTETALVEAGTEFRALTRLRDLGVRLALDDFGTGYSSLSRLSQAPVDVLKIDRTFVTNLDTQADAAHAVVASIVTLAHALGLHTVAEGIEHDAQRIRLADLGCDAGQGFLWSTAVPPLRAEQIVAAHASAPS